MADELSYQVKKLFNECINKGYAKHENGNNFNTDELFYVKAIIEDSIGLLEDECLTSDHFKTFESYFDEQAIIMAYEELPEDVENFEDLKPLYKAAYRILKTNFLD